jgi:hypothetical protein
LDSNKWVEAQSVFEGFTSDRNPENISIEQNGGTKLIYRSSEIFY